jgi:hypothetical protein
MRDRLNGVLREYDIQDELIGLSSNDMLAIGALRQLVSRINRALRQSPPNSV